MQSEIILGGDGQNAPFSKAEASENPESESVFPKGRTHSAGSSGLSWGGGWGGGAQIVKHTLFAKRSIQAHLQGVASWGPDLTLP